MGRHSISAGAESIVAVPAGESRRAQMRTRETLCDTNENVQLTDSFGGALAPEWDPRGSATWPTREEFTASLVSETPISIQTRTPALSFFKRSHAVAAAAAVVVAGVGAVVATSGTSSADSDTPGATLVSKTDAQNAEVTFTVVVDGATRTVTSSAGTLADALAEAGILVDGDDIVSAAMAQRPSDGATVTIVRVGVQRYTETVTDPFQSSEVEDDTLAKGTKKVVTEGQDGIVTNSYDVTYKDGVEESRVLAMSGITQQRIDEVVHVGTKEAPTAAAAAAGGYIAPAGEAQEIAYSMLSSYGWGDDQFSCLVSLWNHESGWRVTASNPSGAYGIPQALPGSKMGPGWESNASVQISWGLGYISSRYSTPCGALGTWQSKGWY